MTDQHTTRRLIVSASALSRLLPLLADRCEVEREKSPMNWFWGWHITPHPERGIIVAATDGRAMGLFYDANGHATEPCFLLPDEGLIHALNPPEPRTVYDCGATWSLDVEKRLLPGMVHISTAGLFILHQGSYKPKRNRFNLYEAVAGDDSGYQLKPSPPFWHQVVSTFAPHPGPIPPFNAELLGSMGWASDQPYRLLEAQDAEDKAIRVTCLHEPAFIGFIMPVRDSVWNPAHHGAATRSWLAPAVAAEPAGN